MTSDNDVFYISNVRTEDFSVLQNSTFNMTLEQYLLQMLGPKHLPLSTVIPLTVIYVFIFVTGVFGNISVCAVIIKNTSLHTATNYYLFSLAVSDLTLLLLGLPNDLSVYWQQYPWALGVGLCKVRALVSEIFLERLEQVEVRGRNAMTVQWGWIKTVCLLNKVYKGRDKWPNGFTLYRYRMSYTSVLTIVAFSTERYLAICHPLHHYAMSGLKRAVRIIGILWIVSLLGAAPFAIYTTVNYLDFPPGSGDQIPESGFCAMLAPNIPPNWPIYEISSLLFFLFPMIVILILYIRMGIRIRKRGSGNSLKRLEGSVHDNKQSNSRKAIIRMLAAVVITFFLCWAPFHAQRLLYLYANHFPNFPEINEWMYHIAGIFYYISSTVNPILYNVMSAKYRLAFKNTLCGFLPRQKTLTQQRNSSNANRLDHSFIYSSPSKYSRKFSQRNSRNQSNDNSNKSIQKDNRKENDCEKVNLLAKSIQGDGIKNTCGVVVVLTPASKKKLKS